jgi:hypothetical protein
MRQQEYQEGSEGSHDMLAILKWTTDTDAGSCPNPYNMPLQAYHYPEPYIAGTHHLSEHVTPAWSKEDNIVRPSSSANRRLTNTLIYVGQSTSNNKTHYVWKVTCVCGKSIEGVKSYRPYKGISKDTIVIGHASCLDSYSYQKRDNSGQVAYVCEAESCAFPVHLAFSQSFKARDAEGKETGTLHCRNASEYKSYKSGKRPLPLQSQSGTPGDPTGRSMSSQLPLYRDTSHSLTGPSNTAASPVVYGWCPTSDSQGVPLPLEHQMPLNGYDKKEIRLYHLTCSCGEKMFNVFDDRTDHSIERKEESAKRTIMHVRCYSRQTNPEQSYVCGTCLVPHVLQGEDDLDKTWRGGDLLKCKYSEERTVQYWRDRGVDEETWNTYNVSETIIL